MASRARKRTYQTDKTREKIRASMLVNRLQDHVEGKAEMSSTQVKAASVLLAKTLPDLTSADIHDSRQPETQTYEEIRLQLIREHGEPLALLLLKEIGQADYLRMLQAQTAQQPSKPVESQLEPLPIQADDETPKVLQ